jgi:hypothetical protein
MRNYSPDPRLLKTIATFDNKPFRLSELRDKYMAKYAFSQDKNNLRRALNGSCKTLLKHQFVTLLRSENDRKIRYAATDKVFNKLGVDKHVPVKANENRLYDVNLLKECLRTTEHEMKINLAATKRLESLKLDMPNILPAIEVTLEEFKEINMNKLGDLKALEALLERLS